MLSVIASIAALVLPVAALLRNRKKPLKKPFTFSALSFSLCLASVCTELYTIKYRVQIKDIAGILDTIDSVLLLCLVASVAVIILNTVYLSFLSSGKSVDKDAPVEEMPAGEAEPEEASAGDRPEETASPEFEDAR